MYIYSSINYKSKVQLYKVYIRIEYTSIAESYITHIIHYINISNEIFMKHPSDIGRNTNCSSSFLFILYEVVYYLGAILQHSYFIAALDM